jgi:CRISPR-associated Csx2 family protein
MHTLVSFLGASKLDPKTGYRRARYRFPDGAEEQTPFFGLALAARLKPDRAVLFGTAGSMWPALIEHGAGDGMEEQRIALIEAAESAAVRQGQLDVLQPLASRLLGCEATLKLIPYAGDESEQRAVLEAIAEVAVRGDVSFDLTHAFRHLSMLGLLSAFMLERVGRVRVRGVWYGALDMTVDGVTPVVRLDGLLAIQRWIEALARFDASGDYGVFAPLLRDDGVDEARARCLVEASFHEATLNLSDARRKLLTFLPVLDQPLAGASRLFQSKLRERLGWVREDTLAEHQRWLAWRALNRGDFLRASILGLEAFITQRCAALGLDPLDHTARKQAEARFGDETADRMHADWKTRAFWTLKAVRNAMAHGTPPAWERMRRLLSDRDALRDEMQACLNRLINT